MRLAVNIALVVLAIIAGSRMFSGPVDAAILYSGSLLAGTGKAYDQAALCVEEAKIKDIAEGLSDGRTCLGVARLPWYLFSLKALSWMPFSYFRVAWAVLCAAAYFGAILIWPALRRRWLCALCGAFWALIQLGQDTTLFMLFAVCAMLALQHDRDEDAGLFFALCTLKFNLGLLFPLLLIAKRKWRAMWFGAGYTIVLLLFSVAIDGPDFPWRLVAALEYSDHFPLAMPTLRTLSLFFPMRALAEVAFGLFVIVAEWKIFRRYSMPVAFAAALAGGVLLARHSVAYDCVLFVPLFFEGLKAGLQRSWLLIITPYFYIWPHNTPAGRVVPGVLALFSVLPTVIWLLLSFSEKRDRKPDYGAAP